MDIMRAKLSIWKKKITDYQHHFTSVQFKKIKFSHTHTQLEYLRYKNNNMPSNKLSNSSE